MIFSYGTMLLFSYGCSSGLAELLVKEAVYSIFLNPLIWVSTVYKVQRELYMFLIQKFDNDPRFLSSLCRLPCILDIIHVFYSDTVKYRSSMGNNPLLYPITEQVVGERPSIEEIRKIRLLLLSLVEMSLRYSFFYLKLMFRNIGLLSYAFHCMSFVVAVAYYYSISVQFFIPNFLGLCRQNITTGDIKALVAFFEISHDMTCIEDVLHMVIRAVSEKSLLASFLEQVNMIGGCQIFVNLLQQYVPVCILPMNFAYQKEQSIFKFGHVHGHGHLHCS